jgi:L-aminopeptidase/D-esterase-like protein
MFGAITDLLRPKVGNYIDRKAATGCTVIVCELGTVAGVPAAKDVSKC